MHTSHRMHSKLTPFRRNFTKLSSIHLTSQLTLKLHSYWSFFETSLKGIPMLVCLSGQRRAVEKCVFYPFKIETSPLPAVPWNQLERRTSSRMPFKLAPFFVHLNLETSSLASDQTAVLWNQPEMRTCSRMHFRLAPFRRNFTKLSSIHLTLKLESGISFFRRVMRGWQVMVKTQGKTLFFAFSNFSFFFIILF